LKVMANHECFPDSLRTFMDTLCKGKNSAIKQFLPSVKQSCKLLDPKCLYHHFILGLVFNYTTILPQSIDWCSIQSWIQFILPRSFKILSQAQQ
jgi:hypothetical protein